MITIFIFQFIFVLSLRGRKKSYCYNCLSYFFSKTEIYFFTLHFLKSRKTELQFTENKYSRKKVLWRQNLSLNSNFPLGCCCLCCCCNCCFCLSISISHWYKWGIDVTPSSLLDWHSRHGIINSVWLPHWTENRAFKWWKIYFTYISGIISGSVHYIYDIKVLFWFYYFYAHWYIDLSFL